MNSPTVGYVLQMFPKFSETFIANEILALESLGVGVRIFSYRQPAAAVPHETTSRVRADVTYLRDPRRQGRLEQLREDWPAFRRAPLRYARTLAYVVAHMLRNRDRDTWLRFRFAVQMAGHLYGSDIRHLHAHMARGATRIAMLTRMLTGTPYSFTAHARDVFREDVDMGLLRRKLDDARFAVTVSKYNKQYLHENLGGSANGNVHVLYNGVDIEHFTPGPRSQRDDGLILAVGRLIEKKGFETLIEACTTLHESGRTFRCEIVGEGSRRTGLERQVRDSGLDGLIEFVGELSQEELAVRYRQAAVFCMPAVIAHDGNRDALPTVILEALACGTPVVASRLAGIPEIVDDGENGLLVAPGDAAELAGALDRLLADGTLRERLGASARSKAEARFDITKNVRRLQSLFETSVAT